MPAIAPSALLFRPRNYGSEVSKFVRSRLSFISIAIAEEAQLSIKGGIVGSQVAASLIRI